MSMFNNGSIEGNNYNDDSFETIIGPMVQVEGTLTSQGNVSIDGGFKGTLEIAHKLKVGKDAKIEAEVKVGKAFIAGTINGNLVVSDTLELSDSAEINGDVEAKVVVMSAGARLNGRCTMGSTPHSKQVASTDKKEEGKQDHKKNH